MPQSDSEPAREVVASGDNGESDGLGPSATGSMPLEAVEEVLEEWKERGNELLSLCGGQQDDRDTNAIDDKASRTPASASPTSRQADTAAGSAAARAKLIAQIRRNADIDFDRFVVDRR